MSDVIIYTDGAARGNPGPGGYGVVLKYKGKEKTLSDGFRRTTNNRMELLAVIEGLKALTRPCNVKIYSDSRYVCDAVEKKWVFGWEKANFKKKKNPDLWKLFLEQYRKHTLQLIWVKGHANIPDNERCDRLAVDASNKTDLKIDSGYEKSVEL